MYTSDSRYIYWLVTLGCCEYYYYNCILVFNLPGECTGIRVIIKIMCKGTVSNTFSGVGRHHWIANAAIAVTVRRARATIIRTQLVTVLTQSIGRLVHTSWAGGKARHSSPCWHHGSLALLTLCVCWATAAEALVIAWLACIRGHVQVLPNAARWNTDSLACNRYIGSPTGYAVSVSHALTAIALRMTGEALWGAAVSWVWARSKTLADVRATWSCCLEGILAGLTVWSRGSIAYAAFIMAGTAHDIW